MSNAVVSMESMALGNVIYLPSFIYIKNKFNLIDPWGTIVHLEYDKHEYLIIYQLQNQIDIDTFHIIRHRVFCPLYINFPIYLQYFNIL